LEEPLREHGNEGQGEHLEAADQHDEDEQQRRLAVGPGQQPCGGDDEQGGRCPVKQRISEYERPGDANARYVPEAVEEHRAQQRGGEVRPALGSVVEQEPGRHRGAPESARDEAFLYDSLHVDVLLFPPSRADALTRENVAAGRAFPVANVPARNESAATPLRWLKGARAWPWVRTR